MIINVLGFTKHQMSVHGIKVNLNLEDSLPIIERCPTQLIQVFSILVTRAINALDKFDRKGKLISISTRYADGNFILEVMDNGLGIPEENLNQLFNTFFSTDVSCEGIDLGLVITNNIVVGIGGSISVRNCEEGGTCFTVYIPVSLKNPGFL
jgi:C4-dicarboxylate-specific signal transduction histidine kinase